jgi:hypothetical protein
MPLNSTPFCSLFFTIRTSLILLWVRYWSKELRSWALWDLFLQKLGTNYSSSFVSIFALVGGNGDWCTGWGTLAIKALIAISKHTTIMNKRTQSFLRVDACDYCILLFAVWLKETSYIPPGYFSKAWTPVVGPIFSGELAGFDQSAGFELPENKPELLPAL